MGRILAIDYGTRRCGLAVTDTERRIAVSLTTCRSHELIDFLKTYFQKEQVDEVVIGEAIDLNNRPTKMSRLSHFFADTFRKVFPDIPVFHYDERFTSKRAQDSLIESGQSRKTRRDKSIIDQISATILLQDYMAAKALSKP